MNSTILVIDDSATIRRMVDSHLSQEGYRVVLAPNSEAGLELAPKLKPQLVLLDHQLPGTTGLETAKKLIRLPECVSTPIVVMSTLRKRAYAEYTDLPNVVDSLPKPFTPELLKTTVANALETGAMVVASQADGSAVPEVLDAIADTGLAGSLQEFRLREVIDFLNNSGKDGMLEVEREQDRVWIYLQGGRIQSVSSAAVPPAEVAQTLPPALQDLAPLLRFTIGGTASSQVDGLVELLDRKVIDPRMLRGLLRHQAAYLLHRCFRENAKSFTFEPHRAVPALFRKLPLDISLAALLVEGALAAPASDVPAEEEQMVYVRCALRGQNLDRIGLSAQHMKIYAALETATGAQPLAAQLSLPGDEVRRVLWGLELADWVRSQEASACHTVLALETEARGAQLLREFLSRPDAEFTGKVVKDRLGLQLLLRRQRPEIVLLAVDSAEGRRLSEELRRHGELAGVRWVGIVNASDSRDGLAFDAFLDRPYLEEDAAHALGQALKSSAADAKRPEVVAAS